MTFSTAPLSLISPLISPNKSNKSLISLISPDRESIGAKGVELVQVGLGEVGGLGSGIVLLINRKDYEPFWLILFLRFAIYEL